MVQNHLKRIAMPRTWTTREKKSIVWVAKVNPGAHSMKEGMPLVLILRELLGYANTVREVKQILNNKIILIDGVRRKEHRFNVGLMDTISITELKENYRISLNKHRKLCLVKIDEKEAKSKICRINSKGLYKGKTQLRLSDGRVILADKKENYKTGDSIIIEVPAQKITEHIKLEKGAHVLLTDGKRIGTTGTIEEVKQNIVRIKSEKNQFETLKKYCYVVGKQKPALTIR